jgi:hypothetical protein
LSLGTPPIVDSQIVAYADASHESAVNAASFSGSIIYYYGAVGWRCQKQDNDGPSLSTTKAKYRACSKTGQDVRWLEQLLQDINPFVNQSVPKALLYCDNRGALALLKNPQYQHRTRHINVRHHWLRHHIKVKDNFQVQYVATDANHADFLTKPLSPKNMKKAYGFISMKIA